MTILNTALVSAAIAGSFLIPGAIPTAEKVEVAPEVVEEKPEPTVKVWILPQGNQVESRIVAALQVRGIDDRNAIATVLGNVKQESRFHPNICEGGHRVSYWGCRSGGYGLIQWTTASRYRGLGNHAYALGLNPSTAEAQISYMFTEKQWQRIEPKLKKSGYSINYYMDQAYYWLGWGVHGNRTTYAYNYANSLVSIDVPVSQADLTDV